MIHIKEVIDDVILDLMERVFNGRAPLKQKIAIMIITRRDYHGNKKVQDKCNEYLEVLYEESYRQAKREYELRISNGGIK